MYFIQNLLGLLNIFIFENYIELNFLMIIINNISKFIH